MPKTHEVFLCTLAYVKNAYRILGVTENPPPLALLVHALCAAYPCPSVSELAELAGLSLQTTSRTLKQMRHMGWVELKNDPVDTRLKRVTLTKSCEDKRRALYNNIVALARDIDAVLK